MPLYEYKCKKCNAIIEVYQSINDKPIKKCTSCGEEVEKIISITGAPQFNGSGFYQTDYAKKPGNK